MQATMIKTAEAQPMGRYEPTAIDAAKALADIRITGVCGGYEIDSRVALSGRGIKAFATEGRYLVTRAALDKLEKQYNVVTDF